MSVHSLRKTQYIPAPIQKVWDFFIDPKNLAFLTPTYMRFETISDDGGASIYPGQIIQYRLSPFPRLRVYWMTEIVQMRERSYFIDEQRRGPYRLWHHQHHFREVPEGVEMTDIVHYELPFRIVGDWVNALSVRRQLEGIFQYRRLRVEEFFSRGSGKF